jgi:hypothetical protein
MRACHVSCVPVPHPRPTLRVVRLFSRCTSFSCEARRHAHGLVALQRDGRNVDFDTYLVPPGYADVFFPTSFHHAARLWRASSSHTAAQHNGLAGGARAVGATDVVPAHVFMNMYAEVARTKTMSAYNPLLDDFGNTAILLADAV